jgi:membrane-associated phospholipid phosphatase
MAIAKSVASSSVEDSRGAFRLPLLALALVAAAGFVVVAFTAPGRPPTALDVDLERAVQAVHWGLLAGVFAWVDWLDGLKQLALAGLGVLAVAVAYRRGLLLMVWGVLSGPVYEVLELTVRRPRPDSHLVHVIRHTTGWSFPSGHEVFYTWFVTYLLLVFARRLLPGPLQLASWAVLPVVLAVVALSRVYTGEHWPSDVLAGLLLGTAWTLLGLSVRRLSDPVLHG